MHPDPSIHGAAGWRSVVAARVGLPALLVLIALMQAGGLLAGCSQECPSAPVVDERLFVVAESSVVPLDLAAGAQHSDTLTGLTFRFPDGASGVLTTGTLVEAPDRPWDVGRGIYLTYDSSEPLQLLVPHDPTGYEFLLGYGAEFGSHSAGRGSRWVALLPADTLGSGEQDSLLFTLATAIEPAGDCEAGRHYWLCEFPTGSDVAQGLEAAVAEAGELLAIWQDSLAAVFASISGARTPAELPPTYFPDGNYYRGFRRLCDANGFVAAPRIGLRSGATRGEIAHQIGHYLMHLLVGDETYREIEAHLPESHGIGELSVGRTALGEDYAHFFAQILTGAIEGVGDPATPYSFFPGSAPNPREIDLPGLNGFGTLLLHVLQRSDSAIVNILGDEVRLPIVGLSRDEVIRELVAPGPWGMSDLRDLAANYLATLGKEDHLAPLAAAVGWMPSGWGQVVGRSWDPQRDAEVRAYRSVDGTDFFTASEPLITDDLGWFTIPALFPGPQVLRVTIGDEWQEFEFDLSWEDATDRNVSLNKLFLWPDLSTLNGLGVTLGMTFVIPPDDSVTTARFNVTGQMHCDGLQGTFERDGVYVPEPVTFEEGGPETAWVLDTLDISYSLETGGIVDYYFRAVREISGTHTLEVRLVASPQIIINGTRSLVLSSLGGYSLAEVQEMYDLTLTGPDGDVYTEEDLAEEGSLLVVKAFRK